VSVTIHPLAEEIQSTRKSQLPDGTQVEANSFIPRDECLLLYEMISQTRARRAIEVGMAFGMSSLCIADALSRKSPDGSRLVCIDSHQTAGWKRAGAHLIVRAGYDAMVTLIEEPSQLVLPRLAVHGERFDFAFIDGWHTFDHALIDFFFIDQILEDGGIVVFDDVGYPAINAVVRFILANRDYELVKTLQVPVQPGAGLRLRRVVKRLMRPLARTDRDPPPENEKLFLRLENVHSVAVRKMHGDRRSFDHFQRF